MTFNHLNNAIPRCIIIEKITNVSYSELLSYDFVVYRQQFNHLIQWFRELNIVMLPHSAAVLDVHSVNSQHFSELNEIQKIEKNEIQQSLYSDERIHQLQKSIQFFRWWVGCSKICRSFKICWFLTFDLVLTFGFIRVKNDVWVIFIQIRKDVHELMNQPFFKILSINQETNRKKLPFYSDVKKYYYLMSL